MCGIFGIAGNISKRQAEHCTNLLAHRGPDGMGVWQERNITLGHRRLSILDLTDRGQQPMADAGGRYCITLNGEIYNFLELRKKLEKFGHIFKTQTDTEVVLAAYAEWGENCVQRFNGMWAFGIWDAHKQQLFLSRDRFGKKPLFYAETGKGFAFASEMKALFPLLDAVRPNLSIVKDKNKIFTYEKTEECVIEGVRRFPAGSVGHFKNGRLSVKRFWCTLDNLMDVPVRYEDQVEQFKEIFVDACRLRMRSDVPIGTALSGGLDSSSIISTIARIGAQESGNRLAADWQHAFVATFPGTPLDESRYARMVTDHLGIDAAFIEIDPLKAIGALDHYLYLFEDIYITSPIPFMLTYGAMKKEGVKVTIDGHGSDECFGGYPFDLPSAFADAGLHIHQIRMILNTIYDTYPEKPNQLNTLPPKIQFWIKWNVIIFFRNLLQKRQGGVKDAAHPAFKGMDHFSKQLYISTHETILPTLLRNYDRYSMANGVEIRMPFLDHRIVSFAFSLPWTAKIRNGYTKAVVRDALCGFMPNDIAYRKTKIGFNSPVVDWMKGPLKAFFQDTIRSREFRDCDLIEPEKTAALVMKVIENPDATFLDGENAWSLLSPFLWERAVIKKQYKSIL